MRRAWILPDSVRLGPHDVQVVPSVHGQQGTPGQPVIRGQQGTPRSNDREFLYGECDLPHNQIRISEGLTPAMQAETFLHEILHACIELGGLADCIKPKQEETIVQSLGSQLTGVLANADSRNVFRAVEKAQQKQSVRRA